MTRVAIIDVLGEHGGMNYYSHGMAAAIAEAGLTVTVHGPSGPTSNDITYRWRRAFVGAYGKGNKVLRAIRLITESVGAAISNVISQNEWVIFHIFRADELELFDIFLAKCTGRKIACIVHDVSRTDRDASKNFMDKVVDLSNLIVVHNAYSRETLCRAAPGGIGKTSIIPHGNYIGQFEQPSSSAARAALGLPAERKVLLLFGSQRREKGLAVLIEALRPLRQRDDLILVVAGKAKPNDEEFYRTLARQNEVEHLIRFDFGHISDTQLPNYYRAASVIMLPYLRIYESGVALMAMSFARPVIASDIPALAALAAECKGVETFASEDVADLSRRIGELVSGEIDLETMGKQAFDFAEQERSWLGSGREWARLLTKQRHLIGANADTNGISR